MAEAGPGSPDWLTSGFAHLWLPYAQMKLAPTPIAVVGAEGARLKLADGRELIDGVSSWWTTCHGYNHPHIREAVAAQLQAVPHVMLGGLATEPTLRLARRLAGLLPGDLDHVFFSESGSVSVEIAMKMAVQYWINRGQKGRHRFVSFRFGYHGDTLAAMSVCDPDEGMHGLFKGYLPQQVIADVPRTKEQQATLTRLLRAHRGEIAAVIIEPLVQGAGGMKFHEPEVLRFFGDDATFRPLPESNPHYALHAHQDAQHPHEFMVRGRARLVTDPALRAAAAADWFYTVSEAYPLYELLIEHALLGERETASDWPPRYRSWRSAQV